MTRQEAFEFFKNSKVYVNSKSAEIQSIAFNVGCYWYSGTQDTTCTSDPFLYFDEEGRVKSGNNMDLFVLNSSKELKAEDILAIKIEEKPEFHTGQAVLVRDSDEIPWMYSFYSHAGSDPYPYCTCGGYYYKECIPYVGNEHLVGTTDKPE